MERGDGERAQSCLALRYLMDEPIVEHHRDLAADQVGHGQCLAAIGHVHDGDGAHS